MTLETFRLPLLLSLVAAITWIAAGACFGDVTPPFKLSDATSLCIHR